jgi:hypothetical protein
MQGFPVSLWSYQGRHRALVAAGMGAALADARLQPRLGGETRIRLRNTGREEKKEK